MIFHVAFSGIRGGLFKSSGSLVKTLQVGTLQLTYAGLSINTPGFSSKVQENPSFQKPPLLKLPLNQTQHFEVFKIKNFSSIIIRILVKILLFNTMKIIIAF